MITFWKLIKILVDILPPLIEAVRMGQDFLEIKIKLYKEVDPALAKEKDEDDTRPINSLFPK